MRNVRVRNAVIAAVVVAAVVAGILAAALSGGGGGGSSKTRTGPGARRSVTIGVSKGEPSKRSARGAGNGSRRTGGHVAVPPNRHLWVGVDDDAVKQRDPSFARRLISISRGAGFDMLVVTTLWEPGLDRPAPAELKTLHVVASDARRQGMRPLIVLWHGGARNTPRTGAERQQFARFAAATAHRLPMVRDFVVDNEPNLNTYWLPQFGPGGKDAAAAGYFDLLARTYDALKAVSPKIRVIGGGLAPHGSDRPRPRPTHSPTAFIRDLGLAYRASGRDKPIMDAFALHPYQRRSRVPPDKPNPGSTAITLADYPRLVALLGRTFDGTAQRGSDLPILYTEFGVQTVVPPIHRHAYTGLVGPVAADAVSPAKQAAYYRRALALAYCQPTVEALVIFHTFDEPNGRGWQSGLYYADYTAKPSLAPFERAAAAVRKRTIARCGGG